ncbi:MAG: DNA-directed RNA polymerase subunit N [Candidatus Aenigmarchaeota archaeon]|nr:DNA-directed RNA polymerase subunit N [Candidatus Aenigmarchaeota archaeon]
MIIPIRCMSCGKPIGGLWQKFKERNGGANPGKLLDELGVKRYCCRALLMTHVDKLQDIAKFRA